MTAPLPAVRPGDDVWVLKYPHVRPAKARIMSVSKCSALAVLYGDGGTLDPDHDQLILRSPPNRILPPALAFQDEASAVAYWNATVDGRLAELAAQYKENVKMLEARRLPVPGRNDEQEEAPCQE